MVASSAWRVPCSQFWRLRTGGPTDCTLRERAEHYRRLVSGPVSVAQQLDGFADECDREVLRLATDRWRVAALHSQWNGMGSFRI